jgi:hypothetical protein
MHGWREVGRIGRAGIPLPTAHYHLDDECYPARLGDHGDVFREWFTWAGIVQWLRQVRLMPHSTSPEAAGNPDHAVSIPKRGHSAEFHEHPAGSTAQQMSL